MTPIKKSKDEIEAFVCARIADILDVETTTIDVDTGFANFGLTSAAAMTLAVELEEFLGRKISPTLVFDHPTVAELSLALTSA